MATLIADALPFCLIWLTACAIHGASRRRGIPLWFLFLAAGGFAVPFSAPDPIANPVSLVILMTYCAASGGLVAFALDRWRIPIVTWTIAGGVATGLAFAAQVFLHYLQVLPEPGVVYKWGTGIGPAIFAAILVFVVCGFYGTILTLIVATIVETWLTVVERYVAATRAQQASAGLDAV